MSDRDVSGVMLPDGARRATPSIPARVRLRARRDATAFYLAELARGILQGELAIVAGEGRTPVSVTEFMALHVEFKQSRRVTRVDIKLRWPTGPVGEIGGRRGDRHGR